MSEDSGCFVGGVEVVDWSVGLGLRLVPTLADNVEKTPHDG